ncbi:MAG: hypothetical protein R2754_18745 [Microthrixaceae bacterium]
MADEMETLSEAIRRLGEQGWDAQLRVRDGSVECSRCGAMALPEDLTVERTLRFEGESDPGDEAVLFAATAPCGHRGTLTATYGPEVPPDESEVIARLPG